MPSPSVSADNATWTVANPEAPSWLACTITDPLARAMTRPSSVTDAIAAFDTAYRVPVDAVVMSRDDPSS